MTLDDFVEPEVAIAVAVTAAVASPPVRKLLRRGAVYGLAGLLIARDKVSSAARELAQSAQQTAAPAEDAREPVQPEKPRVVTA